MSYLYSCHFPKSAVAPRNNFKGLKPPRHCIQQLPHQKPPPPENSWIKLLCHLFCIKSKGHSFLEMPSAYNLKPGQDYADLPSAQTLSRQTLIRGGGVRGTASDWLEYAEQNRVARAWPSFLSTSLTGPLIPPAFSYLPPTSLSFFGRGGGVGKEDRQEERYKEKERHRHRGRAISSSQKPLRRQCTTTRMLLQQPLAGFCLLATGRWMVTLWHLFPAPEEHRFFFSEPFRLAMAAAFPFFLYSSSTWELELSPTSTSIVWTLSRTSLQCQPDAQD